MTMGVSVKPCFQDRSALRYAHMKAVDFAVSQILPEDLRQPTYDLSKKGMASILAGVASRYPDQFRDISKRLGDLGRNAAWWQGYSTTANDTLPVIDTGSLLKQMDAELAYLNKRRDKIDSDDFEDQRVEILQKYSDIIEKETMRSAKQSGNAFARAVISGARGNPAHVKAILSTPGIYTDAKGRVIPLFVRNSFAAGVRPAEQLAGTYGARLAVVSTKKATAKGGDLLKLWNQNVANYNVTEDDCGVTNGIDLDPQDDSLAGRVLARQAGDIPAGTVIDRSVLAKIRKMDKPIIVRSAMTCRAKHGVCAHCVGVQAGGKFPEIGDSIGITAASSIGEPIVQGSLNCLAEGTLVRMADYSTRPIQDVTVGEFVLGADIHGNTFPVEVLAVHDQGMQPVQTYTYSATPKSAISVTCTEIHKLLQITEYWGAKEEALNRVARKLPAGRKAGRLSAVLPGNHTPLPDLKVEPLAAVVGYFLGDGIRAYEYQGGVYISCACLATIDDLRKLLQGYGVRISKCGRSHDWRISKDTNAAGRSDLRLLVSELGLDGKYAHEKELPAAVWGWSQESCAALLAGFIAADGSVYRNKEGAPGVSFASTALPMLEGFKLMLAVRFGIHTGAITRTGEAGKGNRTHDMWQFTINRRDQVTRLHDAVAYAIPGRKGRKLTEYLRDAKPSKFQSMPHYKAKRKRVDDAGVQHCWDLSVAHADELFVLANHLIVSNTKHNAGMAKGKKTFSGLDTTIQFVQIPDEFKDRAAVAELDGTVEKVADAPQGGTIVTIGGQDHFVLPGYSPTVKPGDKVEAGDIVSEGLANPADIVRTRGLGEGRRYYADRLGQILTDSGNPPDKRHMELIARAVVDNFKIDDPDEDSPWMPDDLVRENEFTSSYIPEKDSIEANVDKSVGSYLQRPVLHYTIGTRVTPKIATRMTNAGVEKVLASKTTPWFKSDMQRLRVAAHDSKDWLASLGTSYLSSQMRTALERGDETDVKSNYHYGPRLAYGADAGAGAFGENVRRTGMF